MITTRRTVIASALALAACAPRAADNRVLRIGYQKGGVLFLAKSRGVVEKTLQEEAATRIEWVEFSAGPPLMEAINAGSVDFGSAGDCPSAFAQAAGAAFKYVAYNPVTGANQGLLVPKASTAKILRDLKGKRIAVTRGSSAHLMIVDALRAADMTLDDIEQVHLAPADAATAFATGRVDGWVIWDPFYAMTLGRDEARMLFDGTKLPKTSMFFLAANAYVESAPDKLKALLDALSIEAQWGNANTGEVGRVISEATGLPADILTASVQRGPLAVLPLSPGVVARQQEVADTFLTIGALPKAVRVEDAVWRGWTGNQG